MNHLMTITKSDGTKQLFEEEKLIQSLKRVNADPIVIDFIVEQVEHEMREGISTSEIYSRAFELLKKHSHPLAAKYSTRRAIFELGPDGFPFEKFVARIFNVWGYESITDQILLGKCVDHEIDVVAWTDKELAMVEAKFHNEFGLKSDLKVVLYVKARYDDLAETFYDYGGKQRKLTERWLVTNTKFTDKAVHYGVCNNLKLIGWNYPERGNLHDLIEQYALQPITSLTSLSGMQKKDLIGRGSLLCKDLISDPAILHSIGINGILSQKVLDEASTVLNMNNEKSVR
jgi:hypothetical protein